MTNDIRIKASKASQADQGMELFQGWKSGIEEPGFGPEPDVDENVSGQVEDLQTRPQDGQQVSGDQEESVAAQPDLLGRLSVQEPKCQGQRVLAEVNGE